MPRLHLRWTALAGLVLSCSAPPGPSAELDEAVGGGANADAAPVDGEAGRTRVPQRHRASVEVCSQDRPPGDPPNLTFGTDAGACLQCKDDTDCVDGINGRCVSNGTTRCHEIPPQPNWCTYDTCFGDSDCPVNAVCVCREFSTFDPSTPNCHGRYAGCLMKVSNNYCLAPGNCRTDGDCGLEHCSPTYEYGCGPAQGWVSFYCHTPSDECTDDADCRDGSSEGWCTFDNVGSKWKCTYTQCFDS